MSLGGFTTLMAGLEPGYVDDRAKALVPMAGSACFLTNAAFEAPGPPMLILHGDADAIVDYEANAGTLYDHAHEPRRLARLVDGTHTGFVDATAQLMGALDHADELGCAALGASLDDIDQEEFDAAFPPDGDYLVPECPMACEGELGAGMDPVRQVQLTRAMTRAFLAGILDSDAEALAFVDEGVGLEGDVVVTTGGPRGE